MSGVWWIEWSGFTRQRLFRVCSGLRLPLERASFLDGEGGFGRTATYYLPCDRGVVVSRRGVISLHQHDLSGELWRVEHDGWSGTLIYDGRSILTGPSEHGEILEIDAERGKVTRRALLQLGMIKGFSSETLCQGLSTDTAAPLIRSLERASLNLLWERSGFGSCTSAEQKYLLDDERRTVLRCVDAKTGNVEWTFEVAPDAGRAAFRDGQKQLVPIRAGFPSVVAVDKRVIVVLEDSTVCSLELATGKLLARARPPFSGIHLVTETSVFFLQASGLSEFDHRTMKEVGRIEYGRDVEALYGKEHPYACAFWLTEESVIWTTLNGVLIGVSRKTDKSGKRVVWSDRPEKAVMPIGEFPLAYGDYLYRAEKGDRLGLYCYRSASPRADARTGTHRSRR